MQKKSKSRKIIAGRYAYEKPLGKGAGGAVYLAEDLLSEEFTLVALKVITAEAASSVQGKMLRREFDILTRLDHRNLVHVYDFGTLPGGGIYLAEEFIDGFSLQDARALLEPNQLIEVTAQILEGLAYMHAMGTIHRDIKPANVMILWSDDPFSKPLTKLVDFGLSSQNALGDTLRGGTRSYMAPEVVRGDSAEFRSDLYSLGVTLYYAMCGVIPFGPRGKDDPPVSEETFRPPEPHRINPSVPLSLSRFTMILLRQVPGANIYDAGQALRLLIEDVDERTHSELKQFNVDVASASVLRGSFEMGLLAYRDERRKAEIYRDYDVSVSNRMILISGSAGVGKSRLLRAILSDYKLNDATVIQVRRTFIKRRFGFAIDLLLQMMSLLRSSNIKGWSSVTYSLGITTTLTQCLNRNSNGQYPVLDEEQIPKRLYQAFIYLRSLLGPKHVVFMLDNIDQVAPNAVKIMMNSLTDFTELENTTIIFAGRTGPQVNIVAEHPLTEHYPLTGFEISDFNHYIYEKLGLTAMPDDMIAEFFRNSDDDVAFIMEICALLIEEGVLKQQSVSHWEIDLTNAEEIVPANLNEAIDRRLNNLSPETRMVIEILSLVRLRIERSIVRSLIRSEQIHEDAEKILNLLQNRNYIAFDFLPNGCFVRVTNRSLQYYVRNSLPIEKRQKYHAYLGNHMMEGWYNGKVKAMDIAEHFVNATPEHQWLAAVFYQEAATAMLVEAPGSDTKFILDAVESYKSSLQFTHPSNIIDLDELKDYLYKKLQLANALHQLGCMDEARENLEHIWNSLVELSQFGSSPIWLKYNTIVVGMRVEVVAGTPSRLSTWEDRLLKYLPLYLYRPEVALIRAWNNRLKGNFALSFELVRRSKIRSELYPSGTLVESEATFGRLYEEIGQLQLAYRYYEHALELAKAYELHSELALASIGMGRILIRSNRLSEAESFIFEGFNAAVHAGRPDLTAKALIEEGRILHKLGNIQESLQRLEDALDVTRIVNHRELEGHCLILKASIYSQQSYFEEALDILRKLIVRSLYQPAYSFTFYVELQKTYGRILLDNGQDEGLNFYENAITVEQSLHMRSDHSTKFTETLLIFSAFPNLNPQLNG